MVYGFKGYHWHALDERSYIGSKHSYRGWDQGTVSSLRLDRQV